MLETHLIIGTLNIINPLFYNPPLALLLDFSFCLTLSVLDGNTLVKYI